MPDRDNDCWTRCFRAASQLTRDRSRKTSCVSVRALPMRELVCPGGNYRRSTAAQMHPLVDHVHLRRARAGHRFDLGVKLAPSHLGGSNELEDSEDRRSSGRHGNQHVRLRIAQVSVKRLPGSRRDICASRGRRIHRAVGETSSNFLCIENVEVGTAIGKVGEVGACGLSFRRSHARLQRVERVEMQRRGKVDVALARWGPERTRADVIFRQSRDLLGQRNVHRCIMLVECVGAFRLLVKYQNSCHSVCSP
jgi:hypothetical protein